MTLRSIFCLFLLVAGCGTDNTKRTAQDGSDGGIEIGGRSGFSGERKQCFSVVNGKETNEYPAVVLIARVAGSRIISRCTGTFVSDNTVVTAAHCVGDGDSGDIVAFVEDCGADTVEIVSSKTVFHHGMTADDFAEVQQEQAQGKVIPEETFKKDLAILVFPDETSPHSRNLSGKKATEEGEVEFVGYGIPYDADDPKANDQINFQDIKKRVGRNTLVDSSSIADAGSGYIIVYERSKADSSNAGDYSTIGSGDSGGPLFFGGALLGITSWGSTAQTTDGKKVDIGSFVDLFDSMSRELIDEARTGGASFDNYDAYQSAQNDAISLTLDSNF